MLRRSLLCCAVLGAFAASGVVRAQAGGDAATAAAVAEAIQAWVEDFERGRLGARGVLRRGDDLQPRYVAPARRAGRLGDRDEERITHLDALQKLLFFAEQQPTPALADAVLGVAAAGLDGAFLDHDALALRELGHWTLMRTDDQGVWFLLLRAAAGERVPVLSDLRPEVDAAASAAGGLAVGPARRAAALQLIGRKNWPVFRSTLEAALHDVDARVRLAAAEALLPPWRPEGVRRLAAAIAAERHPMVSQALVRQLLQVLRTPPAELDGPARDELVAGALAQFGRCGWRTDMDLLDLVEAFPHKAAIPTLIAALDLEQRSPDALVTAINKRASPLLRQRAGGLLRAMTGALLPIDDPGAWRAFWQREGDRVEVPAVLARQRPDGTRAQFFGVPVTGASVVFLIDTSGSMDAATSGPVTGPRRRDAGTRLGAAKEQLLLAAQSMPPESQFFVVTFAERGRSWTAAPIKPGPSSLRALTELLSRLRADGGTDLHDGLAVALRWHEQRHGVPITAPIDELFVLSDGQPTAGEIQDTERLLAVVRAANAYARVRIHTVFTGTGDGAVLLRRLAEENGGVFVQR